MSAETHRIRVLLVEDHNLVREGLKRLLEDLPDMEVIADTDDPAEATRIVQEQAPDVVLLDWVYDKDDTKGRAALIEIRRISPMTKVVVLSAYSDEEYVFAALANGAVGYLLKNADPPVMIEAIRDASKGLKHLSPLITKIVVDHLTETQPAADNDFLKSTLTSREIEVFQCILQVMSNKEIADRLHISIHTVKVHVSNILQKLGLENRHKLVQWAEQKGLARGK